MTLQDEAVGLLQQLLRLNTVNPPGNETIAAELLRDYLEANGVEVELYARTPERANLVARLKGGDGPSLCFLSHTDTVVADPDEWSRDPWSGDLADDHVWGRGALDMKNQVAASAVAIASLAREGFKPPGDLVFVAAADEEVGKNFGLQWLCEEHPDAVRVDYAINEGGGERIELGGSAFYLCATAEKMSAPFRVVVHGRSGHASMPGIADNALVKTAPLIERLAAYRPEPSISPEVAGFLDAVLGEQPAPADVLSRLAAVDRLAVETIEPLLSFTLSPTMIEASERRNVVPGTCELVVDRRLLPGQTPEDVEPIMRQILGDGEYELETIERFGGTRSDARHATLDGDLRLGQRDGAGREAGSPVLRGVHRLALAARRIRHGRVRVLPAEDDGDGGRGAPDPLGRRADARRRSGARRRVPARRRPLAGVAMLELRSPENAFELIEAYLRERGFFVPGGEELEADLYLGYGLSEPLRRTKAPAPPEPCPLPLAAVSVRDTPGSDPGHVRMAVPDGSGSEAGTMRSTRRQSKPCARRSGAVTSTRSISCSTSPRRSSGNHGGLAHAARRLRAPHHRG